MICEWLDQRSGNRLRGNECIFSQRISPKPINESAHCKTIFRSTDYLCTTKTFALDSSGFVVVVVFVFDDDVKRTWLIARVHKKLDVALQC